jgi:hypothetical protein
MSTARSAIKLVPLTSLPSVPARVENVTCVSPGVYLIQVGRRFSEPATNSKRLIAQVRQPQIFSEHRSRLCLVHVSLGALKLEVGDDVEIEPDMVCLKADVSI